MPLWLWILLFLTVIKLPLAGLMLWMPFRNDEAMRSADPSDSSEEDGGSRALPGGPLDPHPRMPRPRPSRRGPHGSPSPAAPLRIRTVLRSTRRVSASH